MNAWKGLGVGILLLSPIVVEAAPTFTQADYRWRYDDGSESTANWKADPNTPITGVKREENIRLRFSVKQGRSDPTSSDYIESVLQYATAIGGVWNNTATQTGDGSAFVMSSTTGYANGDPTTDQLGSFGSFTPGQCVETPSNMGRSPSVMALTHIDMEYCLQATLAALRNQTYYFRLTKKFDGTPLNGYDVYAQLTIEDAPYTNLPRIVSSLEPQELVVGVPWIYTIGAYGVLPIEYGAQGLPAGITRSGAVLSGHPMELGTFPVTLTVSNEAGLTSETLLLNVVSPSSGLRMGLNQVGVTLVTGGTATVAITLTNLGPVDIEWAVHIQGGTAPGGTPGAIDKTFSMLPSGSCQPFAYRDCGTADTEDDEIWLDDGVDAANDYSLRRRRVSDWSDLGLFEKSDGDPIKDYCQFGTEGDRYWSFHNDNGAPGFSLIDVGTKSELRRIRLAGVPLSPWAGGACAVHPSGVAYHASYETDANNYRFTMWQSRSRDGRLIASHGVVPSMKSAIMGTGTALAAGYECWKDGHFWFYGAGDADATSVKLWRWTPGMDDAVMVLSFPAGYLSKVTAGGICPAAEPGFVWVWTVKKGAMWAVDWRDLRHVDTGFRPWLRPASSSGTLANGASQSLTVQFDATTAPVGTYHAALAITQYPHDTIPQIVIPVTLTVTSGSAPADSDGDGMLDSWENTYLGGTDASPTADADSDGMSNLNEYLAGTLPNDPGSVLRIVDSELQIPNSELTLRWLSATGKKYTIQKSTNLMSGFTATEASGIDADPPTNSYPVTLGASGSGFYRVKLE